jgi:hypothetical protein
MSHPLRRAVVRRDKKGSNTEHPISGEELRALRRLKREQQPGSPFVFMTERGGPMCYSENIYSQRGLPPLTRSCHSICSGLSPC